MTDTGLVERGRAAYERRAWEEARTALSAADERGPLGAGDLDLLGTAAYLTGRPDTADEAWQRAYRAFTDGGEVARAVRCAFWLALILMQRGEHARGGGWLARAQGVLDETGLDCVERGYLLIPVALQALQAMRTVVGGTEGVVERARVLAAHTEIALAAGEIDTARAAAEELGSIAADFDSAYLRAVVEHARGSILLAGGDAAAACSALRRAWASWQELDAAYEAALVRLRMAQACRHLGDHDTAEMELDAARRVFEELGAAPALARVQELAGTPRHAPGGLTAREVEVLRLVATGVTNREIAEALVISEKTVARHLANIFAKLDLPSRSAATAFAHRHGLL